MSHPARQLNLFKGKRQKGEKLPLALEFKTQCMVADTLKIGAAKGWLWSHFPAGEKRDPKTAARLQRMGVMPGWPDLLLIDPQGRLHCLELKRGPAPLNEAQKGFRAACEARGVPYEVCRSFGAAIEVLTAWGALRLRLEV